MGRKLLPLVFFGMAFLGFLAFQIFLDIVQISAGPSSNKKNKDLHYEKIYSSLTLTTIDNKKYSLKALKSPVVILNFWASWCLPCLKEFPSLVSMKRKYPDSEVMVFGINTDESKQMKKIMKIQKRFQLNFPIVADKNDAIFKKFLVDSIPFSVVFHNGKKKIVSEGFKNFDSKEFHQKLDTFIKASRPKLTP